MGAVRRVLNMMSLLDKMPYHHLAMKGSLFAGVAQIKGHDRLAGFVQPGDYGVTNVHQSFPLPSGKVIVKLVQAIVSPMVIAVVFMIISADEVPQVP